MKNLIKLLITLSFLLSLSTGSLAALDDGLNAYWQFDSGSGSTAEDSSGNGNDGAINSATWTSGKFDDALSFGGNGENVDIPDLINNGEFTISFWFRPEGSNWGGSIYDMTQDPRYFYISAQSSQMQWYFEDSEDDDMQITVSENFENTWHHITVTGEFNSNGPHEVFINGSKKASNSLSTVGKPDLASPRIGATTDTYASPGDFQGKVDEFRIYNRRLSDSEIEDLYSYRPEICDRRGSQNECIVDQSQQLEAQIFDISSVFISEITAEMESLSGQATLNIDNSTRLSGLWTGSFFFQTQNPVLEPGLKMRPENGNIVVGEN
jgi:hypothetical protein